MERLRKAEREKHFEAEKLLRTHRTAERCSEVLVRGFRVRRCVVVVLGKVVSVDLPENSNCVAGLFCERPCSLL